MQGYLGEFANIDTPEMVRVVILKVLKMLDLMQPRRESSYG